MQQLLSKVLIQKRALKTLSWNFQLFQLLEVPTQNL